MKTGRGQISAHQLAYVLLAGNIILNILILPSSLAKTSGKDAWLVVLTFYLIDAAVCGILLGVHILVPNKSAFEIVEGVAGRLTARIAAFLFAMFYLLKLQIIFSGVEQFMIYNMYNGVKWNTFAFPVAIVLGLIAFAKLKSIARMIEMLRPVIIILLAVTIFMLAKESELKNLLPVFENGTHSYNAGFKEFFYTLGDFMPLLVFLGKFKSKDKVMLGVIFGVGVPMIVSTLLFMFIHSFYDKIMQFMYYGLATFEMAKFATVSDTLARIDLILMSMWLIIAIAAMSINAYCISECFRVAFKLDEDIKGRLICSGLTSLCIFSLSKIFIVMKYRPLIAGMKFYIIIPFVFASTVILLIMAFFYRKKFGTALDKRTKQLRGKKPI